MSGNTALGVSLGCSSSQCTPSSTVLCSMVANTNQVFGCYVGEQFEKGGVSTFSKQICAPITFGTTYGSASYCKV